MSSPGVVGSPEELSFDYTEGASALDIQDAAVSQNQTRRRPRRDSQIGQSYAENDDDNDAGAVFDGPGSVTMPSSVSRMSRREMSKDRSRMLRRMSSDYEPGPSRPRFAPGHSGASEAEQQERPTRARSDSGAASSRALWTLRMTTRWRVPGRRILLRRGDDLGQGIDADRLQAQTGRCLTVLCICLVEASLQRTNPPIGQLVLSAADIPRQARGAQTEVQIMPSNLTTTWNAGDIRQGRKTPRTTNCWDMIVLWQRRITRTQVTLTMDLPRRLRRALCQTCTGSNIWRYSY